MKICNNCRYLSITEAEQIRLRRLGIDEIHVCNKFGKRVYHRSTVKYHDFNIYPCRECEMEDEQNG